MADLIPRVAPAAAVAEARAAIDGAVVHLHDHRLDGSTDPEGRIHGTANDEAFEAERALDRAAKALRGGGVVAPTELDTALAAATKLREAVAQHLVTHTPATDRAWRTALPKARIAAKEARAAIDAIRTKNPDVPRADDPAYRYRVGWIVRVDHPELRGPTYLAVPAGKRLPSVDYFKTRAGAVAFFNDLRSGAYDAASEFVEDIEVARRSTDPHDLRWKTVRARITRTRNEVKPMRPNPKRERCAGDGPHAEGLRLPVYAEGAGQVGAPRCRACAERLLGVPVVEGLGTRRRRAWITKDERMLNPRSRSRKDDAAKLHEAAKKLWLAANDPAPDPAWEIEGPDDRNGHVWVTGTLYNGTRKSEMIAFDDEGPYLVGSGGDRWRWEKSERRPAGTLYRETFEHRQAMARRGNPGLKDPVRAALDDYAEAMQRGDVRAARSHFDHALRQQRAGGWTRGQTLEGEYSGELRRAYEALVEAEQARGIRNPRRDVTHASDSAPPCPKCGETLVGYTVGSDECVATCQSCGAAEAWSCELGADAPIADVKASHAAARARGRTYRANPARRRKSAAKRATGRRAAKRPAARTTTTTSTTRKVVRVNAAEVQSVAFKKSAFDVREARAWLRAHGFKADMADDATENWHRFRQQPPGRFRRLRVKPVAGGTIGLVIGAR